MFQKVPKESDIDENGHVTYRVYLDFAAACVERKWNSEKYKQARYRYFSIRYHGEALCGDLLDFKVVRNSNEDEVLVFVQKGDNTIVKMKFSNRSKEVLDGANIQSSRM